MNSGMKSRNGIMFLSPCYILIGLKEFSVAYFDYCLSNYTSGCHGISGDGTEVTRWWM